MKKFNIFEIYGHVHNDKIETPKVEVQAYSPISTKRRTPKIVDGKFSLMESLKESADGARTLATDVKRHFLEIISTYNSFREQMSRQSDIVETANTLGGVVDAAKELTLAEGNDWFDKITIKRNMTELDKLDKQFDKFAIDAKQMDERLHALYEDMGHILGRYYEISDIDPAVMNQRLGKVNEATKTTYKHILMLRNDKTDEVFKIGAFTAMGDAQTALQAFKKTAPSHMEYYLTKK
jgi:hypothetical protein